MITGDRLLLTESLKYNLPIEYIFEKPFKIEELLDRIINIKKDILNEPINIKSQIMKILNPLNFNINALGYSYLLDIIIFCIDNQYKLTFKVKDIFSSICKREQNITSPNKVKWNIDKAIKNMINNTSKEVMKDFFKTTNLPTAKTVISRVLELFYKY